ncbi:MAG: hypothetical protein PF503_18090 [Desulfobacula sp.]|jgi:hypothetical protein|nr:hypothetical protein [Desulfobacula sp.]
MTAYKASRKSLGVEVSNGGFIVWEALLEVWQSLRYKSVLVCMGIGDTPYLYSVDHSAVCVASS